MSLRTGHPTASAQHLYVGTWQNAEMGIKHFLGRNKRIWCRPEHECHVGLPKMRKIGGRNPVQFITKQYGMKAYGGVAVQLHTYKRHN